MNEPIIAIAIMLASAACASAATIGFIKWSRRRAERKSSALVRDYLKRAFDPSQVEQVDAPVGAEHLTVLPDRYCVRCDEPRGGGSCPLCNSKTIEIPADVLAEEIEAQRPKGST